MQSTKIIASGNKKQQLPPLSSIGKYLKSMSASSALIVNGRLSCSDLCTKVISLRPLYGEVSVQHV